LTDINKLTDFISKNRTCTVLTILSADKIGRY